MIRIKLIHICRVLNGEGNGTPLQYSCLENPTDGGAWWAAVHGVVKSRTRLSDFSFTFHFHALEKEMATHSSVLAWRIPGTGSLVGCRLWGRTESDRLKWLSSSSMRNTQISLNTVFPFGALSWIDRYFFFKKIINILLSMVLHSIFFSTLTYFTILFLWQYF